MVGYVLMASARIQRISRSSRQKPAQDRSSVASDVPEEIRCKICKNRYEDPKLLPCLHTFCRSCLEKNLQKHGGVLYCPICPGEIRSAYSDVDKLLSNFMVSHFLQAIDLKRGTSSKQCESCDENVAASSRCFECSDFLCDNCVEAHRRVRFTKLHRVVSVTNLSADDLRRMPRCSTHAHEAVKMFCKQCKKLVCRSCILNQHDDHVLVSLKDAVDEAKPRLNTLLVSARAKISILQRKLKNVYSSQEKLESKVDSVIKDIQATSARILMAVKRREKDLYRMLRRIHDKKSDELESRQGALQKELAQVLDSCEFTDELMRQGNEAVVLHMSELAYTRLKMLGEKEIESVPEIQENEIEYIVTEEPILEELKAYGKVLSKEEILKNAKEKERQERKERRRRYNDENEKRGNDQKENTNVRQENETEQDAKKERTSQEGGDGKKPSVERRGSWLQSLPSPRALLRRLSFGGDEGDGKRGSEQSEMKDQERTEGTSKRSGKEEKEKRPLEQQRTEKQSSQQEIQNNNNPKNSQMEDNDSGSNSENIERNYAEQQTDERNPPPKTIPSHVSQVTTPDRTNDTTTTPQPQHDLKDPEPSNRSEDQSTATEIEADYDTPKSTSILKKPSSDDRTVDTEESTPANPSQGWTIIGDTPLSGGRPLSYLPTLSILTKNRRGRPRQVEIELESPDNSIVSAQILDHKNGTYTIFYCPLTPGEHNLYINLGGKNIKHGKKVLNFYGKFGGMGAEELFLTRRALSCIRWQVTPGFVEIKDKKIRANLDI